MSARAGFCFASILALAMAGVGATATAKSSQENPQEVLRVVQPEETPPPNKKSTNFFDPLDMQAFSVALLLGEIQGTAAADNLPDGAKKALADVRDFLPYKSYRLLDTQWIRCCASPTVEGRLRGLDEQYYPFGLVIQGVSGMKMTAHFWLSDAASDAQLSAGKKRMMSSGFSMETGETVVIGTSSLKGDKALVVLLTAVPRSSISKTKKGSVK
jgi:hypothetical protein